MYPSTWSYRRRGCSWRRYHSCSYPTTGSSIACRCARCRRDWPRTESTAMRGRSGCEKLRGGRGHWVERVRAGWRGSRPQWSSTRTASQEGRACRRGWRERPTRSGRRWGGGCRWRQYSGRRAYLGVVSARCRQ